MTRLADRRTRSRTAFAVLLVWLFTIGAGWANACLLQSRSTHGHLPFGGAPMSDRASVQLPSISPAHLGADSDHPDNGGTGKRVCLKVCDDGTQAMVKLAQGWDLTDAALAPPAPMRWVVSVSRPTPQLRWRELTARGPDLPLRTRFVRLAL